MSSKTKARLEAISRKILKLRKAMFDLQTEYQTLVRTELPPPILKKHRFRRWVLLGVPEDRELHELSEGFFGSAKEAQRAAVADHPELADLNEYDVMVMQCRKKG